MINKVISGLEGCQAHIDDIIVYSDDWQQHAKQTTSIMFLCSLRNVNLIVDLVKSGWISPVTAKVEAIANFPVPTNQCQLV